LFKKQPATGGIYRCLAFVDSLGLLNTQRGLYKVPRLAGGKEQQQSQPQNAELGQEAFYVRGVFHKG
jgi:hypothetical protein